MEGQKLRELINRSGYSVSKIASRMGISQSALSHQMSRECSERYYERIKWLIKCMKSEKEEEQVDHVKDFSERMDILFRAYQNDGCMENYSYKYVEKDHLAYFTVGMKDNEYMYSALDGALHIYSSLNEGSRLVLDSCGSTETTETFSIGIQY